MDDPETFPSRIKDVDFADQARIRCYEAGVLNVAYNCVDRHLEKRGDQTAILWENDESDQDKAITCKQLFDKVLEKCPDDVDDSLFIL